jgi:uncharacterized protein YdeI (YjbR/CyaY-like superfamily)
MEIVEPENLAEWRAWLDANHETSKEIWLVLKKGGKGAPLSMTDAVDEALCFGWIDSRTKRLDGVRYLLRLTPRKQGAKWSERNLQRVRVLIDEGRMTDAGEVKLPNDFRRSVAATDSSPGRDQEVPPELEKALKLEASVWTAFMSLTPGRRKEFIRWVSSAKRPETREKRIRKTVELVGAGRSLTEEMMSKWTSK